MNFKILGRVILMGLLFVQYLIALKTLLSQSHFHFELTNHLRKNKYVALSYVGKLRLRRRSGLWKVRFRALVWAFKCQTPSPAISESQDLRLSDLLEFFLPWYPKLITLPQRSVSRGSNTRIWGEFSLVNVLIWIFSMGLFYLKCFLSEGCKPVTTRVSQAEIREIWRRSDITKMAE